MAELSRIPRRYDPTLRGKPLTFSEPVDSSACAATALRQNPRAALPAIHLDATLLELTERWTPRNDLLESDSDDTHFVAEVDDDGAAHLRFGDGSCGRAVEPGIAFVASYRTGNGRTGLVGPESIAHAVFRRNFNDVITAVRNPLASTGAVAPETVQEAKAFAPSAFRKDLARAVTAADYAALAQRLRFREPDTRLQSTSAELQWNGSWYEAAVALDPVGTSDLDTKLQRSVEHRLQRYRRMGHDLSVGSAGIVPLRLVLDLCVRPEYLRAHVTRAVLDVLSSRGLPGGQLGFFHPDQLTFGESVYVSRIIAAVMKVDGVTEVHVVALERLAHERQKNPDIDKGLLVLAANEIARLDNDPAEPENGILTLRRVRGGR